MPEILRPKTGDDLALRSSDYLATCNYACNPKSTAGSASYYKHNEQWTAPPKENKCYSSISVNDGSPSSCEVAWDLQANNIKCKCKKIITDTIDKEMFAAWIVKYIEDNYE